MFQHFPFCFITVRRRPSMRAARTCFKRAFLHQACKRNFMLGILPLPAWQFFLGNFSSFLFPHERANGIHELSLKTSRLSASFPCINSSAAKFHFFDTFCFYRKFDVIHHKSLLILFISFKMNMIEWLNDETSSSDNRTIMDPCRHIISCPVRRYVHHQNHQSIIVVLWSSDDRQDSLRESYGVHLFFKVHKMEKVNAFPKYPSGDGLLQPLSP